MPTLEDRLRAGSVTLVFDAANVSTSALFSAAKTAVQSGANIKAVVPVTAHLEKLLDLRQTKGAHYDPAQVRKALEDAGVVVLALDVGVAESVARRLHGWFPTDQAWQTAKRARLGFQEGKGRAPASIDWVTAAMCPEEAIVVTDDAGAEWRDCERVGSRELLDLLSRVAAPTPRGAGS